MMEEESKCVAPDARVRCVLAADPAEMGANRVQARAPAASARSLGCLDNGQLRGQRSLERRVGRVPARLLQVLPVQAGRETIPRRHRRPCQLKLDAAQIVSGVRDSGDLVQYTDGSTKSSPLRLRLGEEKAGAQALGSGSGMFERQRAA